MMEARNDSSTSSTKNAATTTTTTTTKINTAEQFLKELQLQVPKFMTQVVSHLQERYRIDCSNLIADHVCWRTETLEEYLSLVECLQKQNDDIGNDDKDDPQQHQQQKLTQSNKPFFDLLIESDIGGRPIATFGLLQELGGITCGSNLNHIIDVIEIPSPKKGSPYRSGLEHVEFVIGAATKKESNHPSSSPPSSSNGKDIGATTTNANTAPANHKNGTTIVTCPMNDSIHHDSLKAFMANHSTATIPTPSISDSNTNSNDTLIVPWNTKALTKTINPDISLKLKLEEPFGICTVKFHLMPLRDVIEWERKHNHGDG